MVRVTNTHRKRKARRLPDASALPPWKDDHP